MWEVYTVNVEKDRNYHLKNIFHTYSNDQTLTVLLSFILIISLKKEQKDLESKRYCGIYC